MAEAGLIRADGAEEEEAEKPATAVVKRERKKKTAKEPKQDNKQGVDPSLLKQNEESSGEEPDEQSVVAKPTEKQVKKEESSDEGAGFDDWENAIEDIANKIVKKTAAHDHASLTKDLASDDEETKDQSSITGKASATEKGTKN